MRWQPPRGTLPAADQPGRALQCCAGHTFAIERLQARPPVRAAGPGQLHKIVISGAEQRRAQYLRQFQIALRHVEKAQQRDQIADRQRVQQRALAGADEWNAGFGQRPLDGWQMGALAREDHHVAPVQRACLRTAGHRQLCRDQRLDARRHTVGFAAQPQVFGDQARRGQRIAQRRVAIDRRGRRIGLDQRCDFDRAPVGLQVRAMRREADRGAIGIAEQRIDEIDHRRGAAPRIVQRHRRAIQMALQEVGGAAEQFGIGAPETVDALLGITDDERGAHAFRITGAHLVEDRPQQLPLRRIGVLELVEHQVLDAPVELVAQPVGLIGIGQQQIAAPFEIGERQLLRALQFGGQCFQQAVAKPVAGGRALEGIAAVQHGLNVVELLRQKTVGMHEALPGAVADRLLLAQAAAAAIAGQQRLAQRLVARIAAGGQCRFEHVGLQTADAVGFGQQRMQFADRPADVDVVEHIGWRAVVVRVDLQLLGQPRRRFGDDIAGPAMCVGPPVAAPFDEAAQPAEDRRFAGAAGNPDA